MGSTGESLQKLESADEETIDLASMPDYQILRIAKGEPAVRDGEEKSSRKWTMKKILLWYRRWSFDSLWWYNLFILSCLLSFASDPLFFYILIVNQDMKCLMFDKKMKKATIILRSLADLPYIVNIFWNLRLVRIRAGKEILASKRKGMLKAVQIVAKYIFLRSYVPIDIVAAVPIPQIIIFGFFPMLKTSSSFNKLKIMNSMILFQYVPRGHYLYTFCKNLNRWKLGKTLSEQPATKIWVPSVINFIMYILASHVLGAFWYLFSVQRVIECWGHACRNTNGCEYRLFDCEARTFRNMTLINDLCPINPSNAIIFDFGIYLDAIQSGMLGPIDFPQKFLQCFSWSLRNLSSFASNLRTSTNAWETLFVVFISISGLLLFIYLLGHLQATNRTYRIWQQRNIIYPQIELMVLEYGLPGKEEVIWKLVKEKLVDDEDLVVQNIFSILPQRLQKHLKRHLFLPILKKVPGLEKINQKGEEAILECLEPAIYGAGNYIIREGEPLDMMIFITQGSVLAYKTHAWGGYGSSHTISSLGKGGFRGEELITWAASSHAFSWNLPISTRTIKTYNKVEVFIIKALELRDIISRLSMYFNTELPQPTDSSLPLEPKKGSRAHLFLAKLKNVPIFQDTGEHLLSAVLEHLEHLEPIHYTWGSYIIREGEPLDTTRNLVCSDQISVTKIIVVINTV